MSESPIEAAPAEDSESLPTLLEQMGGWSGFVYSTLPVLVLVPVNSFWGLGAALVTALLTALAILVLRMVRKEKIMPAVSGFLGVVICAVIAYLLGEPKAFFIYGIVLTGVFAVIFLFSLVVRYPAAGVVWNLINGNGSQWRSHRQAVRWYDLATLAWLVVFIARFAVQARLYSDDATAALGVARIVMGWPLTVIAVLVTILAVRRADAVLEGYAEAEAVALAEVEPPAHPTAAEPMPEVGPAAPGTGEG